MNRDAAVDLLDRLHKAQNEFYAGGSGAALQTLLAPNITWTVPSDSGIAGTHRGFEQVLDYFRRRRDLADRITACWLLPLDQRAFDVIWSPRS